MNPIDQDILNGWTIVIIDDEPDSLMVAEIILQEYGANVYTAENGRAGLELIREIKPNLVISDLSMPVMDGWGVIFNMKNDHNLMDIPAIALTAHAMPGDRERTIAAGFHNHMTKPLTASTFLTDLLKRVIDLPQFNHIAV
jgi:CheY-like chemotaxis protein